MLHYIDSDLFESPAKVLVNTVNTQGVMGKGVALRFKRIYPEMFQRYQAHCEHGRLTIGRLHLYKTPHKWILNFPTKKHWRNPSRPEDIEAGLEKFAAAHTEMGITSVAFPQLGCGSGDLDFETQVRPLMERYLGRLPVSTLVHIGQNHVGPPNRRGAARIRNWLRSEPPALAFDEVWQDLRVILQSTSDFRIRGTDEAFSVRLEDDPPMMLIESSNREPVRIGDDELIDFWQQFNDIGLTHPDIALHHWYPSYLMPVFEHLPYVGSIVVSKSASGLQTNPTTALQRIPPPETFRRDTGNLFGSELDAA